MEAGREYLVRGRTTGHARAHSRKDRQHAQRTWWVGAHTWSWTRPPCAPRGKQCQALSLVKHMLRMHMIYQHSRRADEEVGRGGGFCRGGAQGRCTG